jgi:hypothetical protein
MNGLAISQTDIKALSGIAAIMLGGTAKQTVGRSKK